jgi:hypothetical protein
MFVTYFYGCYWLPAFLTLLDFEVTKLGESGVTSSFAHERKKTTIANAPESALPIVCKHIQDETTREDSAGDPVHAFETSLRFSI